MQDMFNRFNIVTLPPGSFFGDQSILMNQPSQFNYVAVKTTRFADGTPVVPENTTGSAVPSEEEYTPRNETWVLACDRERLIRYSKEYPKFHLYLIQRSRLRRAHWHKIELEYE